MGSEKAAQELCAAAEEFLDLFIELSDEVDMWDLKRLELAIQDFKFADATP